MTASLNPEPLATVSPGSGREGRSDSAGEVEVSAVGEDLAVLRAQFPAYKIWQEHTPGRVRYVARSRHTHVNPHTVITADLAELRDVLHPASADDGGSSALSAA